MIRLAIWSTDGPMVTLNKTSFKWFLDRTSYNVKPSSQSFLFWLPSMSPYRIKHKTMDPKSDSYASLPNTRCSPYISIPCQETSFVEWALPLILACMSNPTQLMLQAVRNMFKVVPACSIRLQIEGSATQSDTTYTLQTPTKYPTSELKKCKQIIQNPTYAPHSPKFTQVMPICVHIGESQAKGYESILWVCRDLSLYCESVRFYVGCKVHKFQLAQRLTFSCSSNAVDSVIETLSWQRKVLAEQIHTPLHHGLPIPAPLYTQHWVSSQTITQTNRYTPTKQNQGKTLLLLCTICS